MHFWIDKRSSQLHNYGGGRGRIPGAGGFYSRTFGNRHHHPPPLLRSSSTSNSNSSSSGVPTTGPTNNQRTSSSSSTVQNNSSEAIANHFEMLNNHIRFHELNNGPTITTNPNAYHHQHAYLPLPRDPAAAAVFGGGGGGYFPPASDPSSQGGNYIGMGIPPSIRRPRSQSHSTGPGAMPPNRRRSSSSSTGSSGGGGQVRRASMNRWTYDPYHINQHNRIHNPQWNTHQIPQQNTNNSSPMESSSNLNLDLSQIPQNNPSSRSQQSRRIISMDPNNSTQSEWRDDGAQESSNSNSAHSIADPAWARTKRIGLTLCFLAFILLSTVAAKFVIEGPWLLDKQPRHERTEATIYFFLTELIFVVFAMALFFTGVTCLRKRTNAYLLRQFNQYIMQTSPQGVSVSTPDWNGSSPHPHPSQSHSPHSQPQNTLVANGITPQPFHHHHHHHFLPLENHLMNMHITVAESTLPPYHVALYFPVPDEGNEGDGGKDDDDDPKLTGHGADQRQSSSWISSCLADNETDSESKAGGDEPSSDDETNAARSKRNSKHRNSVQANQNRPETPPPPYGQI